MIVYDATNRVGGREPWVYLGAEHYALRSLDLPRALSDEELSVYVRRRLDELFPVDPESLAVDAIRLGSGACLVVAIKRELLQALRARHPRARIASAVEGPWDSPGLARLVVLPGCFERVDFGEDGSPSLTRLDRPAGDPFRLPLLREAAGGESWELVAAGKDLAFLRAAPPSGARLVDLDARPGRRSGLFSSGATELRKKALPFAALASTGLALLLALSLVGARVEVRQADLDARRRAFSASLTELGDLRDGLSAPETQGALKPDALDALAALAASAAEGLVATRISVEGGAVVMEARARDALAALEAARAQNVVRDLALRGVLPEPGKGERFTMAGRLHDGE